jgi:hypothetical protein
MLRKLAHNPEAGVAYTKIFAEQEASGIIEEAPKQVEETFLYHLPHHPVINPNKPNKVRIVFDGSSKAGKKAKSLNEVLYPGPVMLPKLIGVLLRFRMSANVVVAE